jgi:hypothetical protein
MLKLILFGACEKAIIADDNLASLISLMERINVVTESKIPPDAVAPMNWTAFSYWTSADGSKAKEPIYCRVDIVNPKGEVPLTSGERVLKLPPAVNQRVKFDFNGFPIGNAGLHQIKLFYKSTFSDDWAQVGEYPIEVRYLKKGEEDEVKNQPKRIAPIHSVSKLLGTGKKNRKRSKK